MRSLVKLESLHVKLRFQFPPLVVSNLLMNNIIGGYPEVNSAFDCDRFFLLQTLMSALLTLVDVLKPV